MPLNFKCIIYPYDKDDFLWCVCMGGEKETEKEGERERRRKRERSR